MWAPLVRLAPWQMVVMLTKITHFFFFGGVAAGKTFTGAQWAIKQILERPELTGFIGANTYDQLSQATLRVFFFWLDKYNLEYVIDCMPPPEWGEKRKFKHYKNIVIVRNPRTGKVTYIFTRVLGKANPLRGTEFSWYWIDESRDTPEYTHDVILGRLREGTYVAGLVTTTTNAEDWCYQRGVIMATGDGLYGSMHVPTIAAVKCGIITQAYFNSMLRTYSPLMAQQELDAKHVNVKGGRAYYSSSERNKQRVAPWGASVPTRDRPLIIGCDFNYSPAPCVWMVGQRGPNVYNSKGQFLGDAIHWFGELSGAEVSTTEMTTRLLGQYPGFFYKIYGDLSGNQGTTSNAGQTDYDQMGIVLSEAKALYSISVEQMTEDESKQNPRVRARVENMCALFLNAAGEIRQTYNPDTCPLFDGDARMVGWKPATDSGRGKLDDGGDKLRTHATDGAGYAMYKEFPPGRVARIIESNPSTIRPEI